ncbi:Glycosyltransferase involved in cell wall bisynthesis [Lutibacter oricola]|uniref:Glycosyltransferase involved in cell wall bisynthesis n=1 Tax=Lutibacter oricola TaxID=762486 RepID=A0A1H2X2E8_9FLAO|nr:glycosyltransferase family 2 protein [Lutibacter oricola]SDW86916.1 Glycosyltransferase involved in cell wall bisynthesis [Lutibacter oricola]
MNPLVSIITPNFNAEKYISQTIESVLNQTYTNWELIIVDDCSTDNSVKIIHQFLGSEAKIKLIKLELNSGAAVARNKGIEIANGDYISFLDSDDIWLPHKLEMQLDFMMVNKYVLTFSSYISKEEGQEKEVIVEAKKRVGYKDLLRNNYIGCLTAMYSVNKLGKVFFPLIKKRQDWALWLKITKKGYKAYSIKKPLAIYNNRSNSISSNKLDLLKYNWKVYKEIEKFNSITALFYMVQLIFIKILKQ